MNRTAVGLSRPSTSFLSRFSQDVDARHEAGHDELCEGSIVAKTNLFKQFNLIWVVQSHSQKYSGSLLTQITSISLPIPAHTKGRFAIVTDVGLGCDGRGWRD
jgi:hypothetical protein